MGKKAKTVQPQGRGLFDESEVQDMFDTEEAETAEEKKTAAGPVECLGQTFPNDEERRKHFLSILAEKLKEPEFRKIEGFPIGKDEDILALSDPPYYTACPNPFLEDFIRLYGKPYDPKTDKYKREPFAADVSEGKNDPIYNAHSYHTKVPHKAIMRYILHYTEPGDLVFDGFCGTGMTGVAAQMCGDRKVVESLGYQVKPDGTILQEEAGADGKPVWTPFSKLGARRAVLNDLSPAATFIAYNYNTPVNVKAFEREAKRILAEVEKECGWMYETKHSDGRVGKINYTVWSDVFVCPECGKEVVFWEAAVDKKVGVVKEKFPCPNCSVELAKRDLERAWVSKYDNVVRETIRIAKQKPVLINYTLSGKRFEKSPGTFDIDLVKRIDESEIPYRFPVLTIPIGDKTVEPIRIGMVHVHDFFTKRNLWAFSALYSRASHPLEICALLGGYTVGLKTARFLPLRWINKDTGPMKPHTAGTLYFPSLSGEQNWTSIFKTRIGASKRAQSGLPRLKNSTLISTQSLNFDKKPSNSVDYIFLDPPFGANLNYSELNIFSESWLKVRTTIDSEAIESKVQAKGLNEYRHLMTKCFSHAYHVLRPGHWMTVEFSNTRASVWNCIQIAIAEAGFIVANVSALDKKQGSFNAVNNTTSVKQDLVISAYKPNGGFEERFLKEAETEEGVWDFVLTHLKYLPVTKRQGGTLHAVPERDPRILFDQMIAYYVRKGYPVPISSQEFQQGLAKRFSERDGMFFLPEQAAEYDRAKMRAGEDFGVQQDLFVDDEATAIEWLRQILKTKPQSFQDINPEFMKKIGGWKKTEKNLDLKELLHDSFVSYEGVGPVPEQIHAYLSSNWKELRNKAKDDPALVQKAKDRWYVPDPNKAGDLEKLRERALLREFEEYRESGPKRLKVFRLEAVRAGFKKAWQERNYDTIIAVAEKIPDDVLQEDPKLLMWFDQAMTRRGGV